MADTLYVTKEMLDAARQAADQQPRCDRCVSWRQSNSSTERGECRVVLPPWVRADEDERFTSDSDFCDLFRAPRT